MPGKRSPVWLDGADEMTLVALEVTEVLVDVTRLVVLDVELDGGIDVLETLVSEEISDTRLEAILVVLISTLDGSADEAQPLTSKTRIGTKNRWRLNALSP